MKDQCMSCENNNKYFPSGCAEDAADPDSNEDCSYYKEDMRCCPTCKDMVARNDMTYAVDCYGIPYKLVCYKCIKATEAELQHYRLEDEEV